MTKSKRLLKDCNLFSYIDDDFKNWNVDEGVQESVELKSNEAIEQTEDFKFSDVFKKTDCISQKDVISFVENNTEECKKYYHFFLLKNSENKFFVARVFFYGDGRLGLDVNMFRDGYVWSASDRHRIFVPATPSNTQNQSLNPSNTLTLTQAIDICKKAGLLVIDGFVK
jgi:hypothetical protein